MATTYSLRKQIALDTISRSESIVLDHTAKGASLESMFITADTLPSIDPSLCPNFPDAPIQIINADSFTAARGLMKEDPDAEGRTAVLNLASDEERAGGWAYTLSKTQEEALCYSSTLYATLNPAYYPWPNLGPGSVAGIFSPGVVIFKDDLDHGCTELDRSERRIVSVITVAAPCGPRLTSDKLSFKFASDLNDLKGKIRLVYRMAAYYGQRYIILGAMGCGAYQCPPRLVAKEMKIALQEPQFKGWFRRVVFAIYSNPQNGPGNYEVFKEIFDE